MEKICCTCKILKPITEFHVNRSGRLTTCRGCAAIKYALMSNELGLPGKVYTQIPKLPCTSYAEHVALQIIKGKENYANVRFDLKFTHYGRRVWSQVVQILGNCK